MTNKVFTPIIGMEIHVELKTKSKMFCGCPAYYFENRPNSCCCPVCLGLPGALPVPNRKAIEWSVMLGLALNCKIPLLSKFDRKNYFYPDLPKGYQISQYDKPFAVNGNLRIELAEKSKNIRIRRVHLEEDTGKLIHSEVNGEKCTLIDFNRSGVPLIEIVTEPDMENSEETRIFLKKVHQIIRYLGISDADMEKGSMRLEPNISLMNSKDLFEGKRIGNGYLDDKKLPKYKVEVKNINSFNFAKKAIDFEIKRHEDILVSGNIPMQETRGWDEKKNITVSQRSKEEAHDYRYFPEPDIPPISFENFYIKSIKDSLPELPDEKIKRFIKVYSLSKYNSTLLCESKEMATFFEDVIGQTLKSNKYSDLTPQDISNWIINKKIKPEENIENLLTIILQSKRPEEIDEQEVKHLITQVIKANAKAVDDYHKGKIQSLQFLFGRLMGLLKGKGNAKIIIELLKKELDH